MVSGGRERMRCCIINVYAPCDLDRGKGRLMGQIINSDQSK